MADPFIILNIGAKRNDGQPDLTVAAVRDYLADTVGLKNFSCRVLAGGQWNGVKEWVIVVSCVEVVNAAKIEVAAVALGQDSIALYWTDNAKGVLCWAEGGESSIVQFDPAFFVMPDGRKLSEHLTDIPAAPTLDLSYAPAGAKGPAFVPFFRLLDADNDLTAERTLNSGQVVLSKDKDNTVLVIDATIFEQIIAAYEATK